MKRTDNKKSVFLFAIDKHVHFYMYIEDYMENMKAIYNKPMIWMCL